jgi:ADP-heptose:LPS heptosyltransferase
MFDHLGVNYKRSGEFWAEDVPQKMYKVVPYLDMRELGLEKDYLRTENTLDDLRKTSPNIVTAEALRNIQFMQNFFKKQELYKKVKYVMGFGTYHQLHYDIPRKVKVLKPGKPAFRYLYRPYDGGNLDGKSILVFRTGGIGDLLFIKPNLDYIKEKYPTCIIRFACGPQYQSMVENWSCVDEVLDLPFRLSTLENSHYHFMFEGVIERCKEAHSTNAYRLFTKWLNINLPDEKLIPQQTPKLDKVEECKEILKKWNLEENSFIVMQLRASSPIRTPNPIFWHKLILELNTNGYKVLLTDNPRQSDNVDRFINELYREKTFIPESVFNFCKHSVSIDYTIAITSLSKGVIATDSALNHLAASLGKPCVGLYGPFPGEVRLSTYPKADWINAVKECAPCFLHGSKSCPKAGTGWFSPCYNNINIQEVIDRTERLFNK